MKWSFFLLIVFALLISACGPSASIAKSNLWRETKPQVSEADLTVLVSGNNTFALDLYRSLRTNEGNLVVSPYSISAAFAMTSAGARGETASQIASTFHFDLPDDRLHPAFNALDLGLSDATRVKLKEKDQSPPELNVVSSIWAQEKFSFETPFLDVLGENYGAGLYLVDFAHEPDNARKKINDFVSRETNDKIKNVIPEDAFGQGTGLVLINTIYFEADWLEYLSPKGNLPFHLLDDSEISVPAIMLEQEYIPYAEGENWLAVELPYAGETLTMVIIIPNAGEFNNFETNVNYELISMIISSLQKRGVDLTLPKFEFSSDFTLADQLKSLGISDAFSLVDADFSGMTGKRDLYLSNTFHKTYISVDEEGTCAAAATGQRFMPINGVLDVFTPVHIDRPFIFIIRDMKSGQFLFIGRVLNPTQQ